jgi:hypothetical protein
MPLARSAVVLDNGLMGTGYATKLGFSVLPGTNLRRLDVSGVLTASGPLPITHATIPEKAHPARAGAAKPRVLASSATPF